MHPGQKESGPARIIFWGYNLTKKSLWKDPNIYIGLGLLLVVVTSFIYILIVKDRLSSEDKGFMKRPINGKVQNLTLAFPPSDEEPVWLVIADNMIDMKMLQKGVHQWNKATNRVVFRYKQNQDYFDNPMFDLASDPSVKRVAPYRFKTVSIRLLTEPERESSGGVTHHYYDLKTGGVYWVDISINPLYTYDPKSYEAAIVHELGHSLLLDDDYNLSSSIMNEELNVYGTITDRDSKLVVGLWIPIQPDLPLASYIATPRTLASSLEYRLSRVEETTVDHTKRVLCVGLLCTTQLQTLPTVRRGPMAATQ